MLSGKSFCTPNARPLPFIVASSSCTSWTDVLRTYQRCGALLKGIYAPTTHELRHGLQQMPTGWAASLFYYSVVKEQAGPSTRPDHSVVSIALQQFKKSGNVAAMQRLFEEDVNTHTRSGAQASLVLASYCGLWEQALRVVREQPQLKQSLSNRRLLIGTLSNAGQAQRALRLLREDRNVDPSPNMIRPIIKRLSLDGEHATALRLAADSFASGYCLNPSLFSGLLRSLRETGQATESLETALELNMFAMPRNEAQRNISVFNGLVDCIYDKDAHAETYSVAEVVQEISSRMQPREQIYRPVQRRQQFRLRSAGDVHRSFARYTQPLSQLYAKCIGVPRWYTKPLNNLTDMAVGLDATILVLDTNFLIQCVSKNLPVEHFSGSMRRQLPHLDRREGGTIVVLPFTTIQEAYTIIWKPSNRLRHSVRLLLWSRVIAFARQPHTYVMTLVAEVPTVSLSVITRMAYTKAARAEAVPTQVGVDSDADSAAERCHRDPDARVLNVCLYFHHLLRWKSVAASQGTAVPEGTSLFALLKYHVRRYTNTVKGSTCDHVVLCTMDKKLSRAATEAGVYCFPSVH